MAWKNPTSASERDGHHHRTKKKTSLLLFPQLLSDAVWEKFFDGTKSVKSLSLSLLLLCLTNSLHNSIGMRLLGSEKEKNNEALCFCFCFCCSVIKDA